MQRRHTLYAIVLGWMMTATLLCGSAMAAPGGSGMFNGSERLDRYVRRGDSISIQLPDGTVAPLMDRTSITKQTYLNELKEVHGEALTIESSVVLSNTPTAINLSAYQTPIKNQFNRRTCWVFAINAAIEARYKHDYNVTLDLSEQYFNHVAKSTGISYPKVYKYENQSSYWGGGNSYAVVSAKDYAIPLESYAPYKTQEEMEAIKASIPEAGSLTWYEDPALNTVTQEQVDAFEYSPKYIPMSARLNAIYGVTDYKLYDGNVARSPSSLEAILAGNKEIIIDVDLKWKYNSSTGIYEYDASAPGGGHVFLLIGYDRSKQYFLVKNSWGGTSYLKVAYNFFQNAADSAAVVNSVRPSSAAPDSKARFIGFWNSDHDGWKGKLVVRRTTNSANTLTRLGSSYDSAGQIHVVNGYSTDYDHGLMYYVAAEAENAPGTLAGQEFIVDQYSWAPEYAAGTTWWNNIPFGVSLARTALNAPYSNSFSKSEWLGTWHMNHDGWQGTLKITSIASNNALTASYVDSHGQTYAVSGSLDTTYNHIATFTIAFSTPQAFRLRYHTWDNGLASGYTYWSNIRYGAHATK